MRLLATTSLIACIAAATIGWILFLGWMVIDLLRWLYGVL
jgi:ABC-type enterochelin transport system permease subunit